MVFGEPILVSADASDEEVEAARTALEGALTRMQADADSRMGHATGHKG
jgi:hypothetical protein